MIYHLKGILANKNNKFIVLDVGGIGYKVFMPLLSFSKLPAIGGETKIFIHYHLRDSTTELYGFLSEEELDFFEKIISISGVGPKSALGIMDIDSVKNLKIAISSGKAELLNQATGIGKKTAERIVLELKQKFSSTEEATIRLEKDLDLEQAIVSLGYRKSEIKKAISSLPEELEDFSSRLKEALRILGKK